VDVIKACKRIDEEILEMQRGLAAQSDALANVVMTAELLKHLETRTSQNLDPEARRMRIEARKVSYFSQILIDQHRRWCERGNRLLSAMSPLIAVQVDQELRDRESPPG